MHVLRSAGMNNSTTEAFLALVRGGLWEKDVDLSPFREADWSEVLILAREQAVDGLVYAGLENLKKGGLSGEGYDLFRARVDSIREKSEAMNEMAGWLVGRLREEGVFAVLVKGQGIAQCYERPLLRSAGDIDLLLPPASYGKARKVLEPFAQECHGDRGLAAMHTDMKISNWTVELHGTVHCGLSRKSDRMLDTLRDSMSEGCNVRIWHNPEGDVFLPSPDFDIIIIFSHILQHFFKNGIGLRQICDLCRLLWTYRDEIDRDALGERLRAMGFTAEWKVFAALIVESLGMPAEAMPLYDGSPSVSRKAQKVLGFIFKVGNFNRKRTKGHGKLGYFSRKLRSITMRLGDTIFLTGIFPKDAFRFFASTTVHGLEAIFHERILRKK